MAGETHEQFGDGGSRPVPDPTLLTTAAVKLALEQEEKRVAGLLDTLRQRLDGMDVAADLRLKQFEHLDGLIDSKVKCVEDVLNEKFEGVQSLFQALKERMAEQKTDTKTALDDALAAAKEAVTLQTVASEKSIDKSETATTKQIDALGTRVDQAGLEKDEKINDLKSRLDRLEASRQGGVDQRTETRTQGSDNRAILAAILGVGGFLFAAIALTAALLR